MADMSEIRKKLDDAREVVEGVGLWIAFALWLLCAVSAAIVLTKATWDIIK